MGIDIQLTIDNQRRFEEAINRARATTSDLRIPLTLIAKDWFRSNRGIFDPGRKSAGQYEELSERYAKAKVRKWGFKYPILRASGALADSLTDPENSNAIADIINSGSLVLGTRLRGKKGAPYPSYLQFGTSKGMPARPFLFIGPEAPRFATSAQMGRPERWFNILNSFVLKNLEKSGVGEVNGKV